MVDAIHQALVKQMTHRRTDKRWVETERMAVALEANKWATAHGWRTVTVDDVERVEVRAVGHVDYATKLALYVAEEVWTDD